MNAKTIALDYAIPIAIASVIGSGVAILAIRLTTKPEAPKQSEALAPQQQPLTPQQRIDQAFDALGMQRYPLPLHVLPPQTERKRQ